MFFFGCVQGGRGGKRKKKLGESQIPPLVLIGETKSSF